MKEEGKARQDRERLGFFLAMRKATTPTNAETDLEFEKEEEYWQNIDR